LGDATAGGSALAIEFVRLTAEFNPGIAYVVETGDNLAALQPLDLSSASVVPIDELYERVTVIDPTITPRRFGRIRVGTLQSHAEKFFRRACNDSRKRGETR